MMSLLWNAVCFMLNVTGLSRSFIFNTLGVIKETDELSLQLPKDTIYAQFLSNGEILNADFIQCKEEQ